MKTGNKVVIGVGVAALAAVVLPRASEATLLDTNTMVKTISVLSASAPVGTRDAENTIHFSTGVISSFGPEVKDFDSNPATELHHIGRTNFVNGGDVANETMFLTSGTSGLFVEYDLGLVVGQLENMYVWNYGEPFFGEPRGVSNLVVRYKINLADPWTLLGTNTLLKASYPPAMEVWDNNVTVIPFNSVSARYVRIEGLDNYGDSGFIGLSEVVITLIPEPSTALLLACGGAVLWRARQRRT